MEAKRILKIPFSLANREDGHFWSLSGNGQYMVSFAYLELNKERKNHAGNVVDIADTSLRGNHPWQLLWKLKLKQKLKVFMWKALNGALPTEQEKDHHSAKDVGKALKLWNTCFSFVRKQRKPGVSHLSDGMAWTTKEEISGDGGAHCWKLELGLKESNILH